jgi:hypothetical protein
MRLSKTVGCSNKICWTVDASRNTRHSAVQAIITGVAMATAGDQYSTLFHGNKLP